MKGFIRKFLYVGVIASGLAMVGCNACAKCTEPTTNVSDEFCGRKVAAESYARGLRAQGWNCTVD